MIINIEQRAAGIAGLHSTHVEAMQVLWYQPGQHFDLHHDLGVYSVESDTVEMVCEHPRSLSPSSNFFSLLTPNAVRSDGRRG